jgi:hypothetical protein
VRIVWSMKRTNATTWRRIHRRNINEAQHE